MSAHHLFAHKKLIDTNTMLLEIETCTARARSQTAWSQLASPEFRRSIFGRIPASLQVQWPSWAVGQGYQATCVECLMAEGLMYNLNCFQPSHHQIAV